MSIDQNDINILIQFFTQKEMYLANVNSLQLMKTSNYFFFLEKNTFNVLWSFYDQRTKRAQLTQQFSSIEPLRKRS